ncbi:2-hydroxyacid dehydrogenase [Actinocatenispora thailandica]|uniref:2-hydroxyacid dehydrogenase n=1 Tax=Actinocatenispora thailandica TaxID=227318 RepID=A0A7R7DP20_9ACTN|nr:2-hydroxyacid dehydrogenase [Actinocatenispora thailandica]
MVVLCGTDRPPGLEPVERAADVRYVPADRLAAELPGADVLFVWDFTSRAVPAAWPAADAAPGWVHIASAGVDTLAFDALRDGDTVLTNSRGVFDAAIAEYVLGLVLAFAKDLPGTLDAQRHHDWRHRETETIAGRPALVVGTGPIGRAIARLLSAAGLRVSGVGRTARRDDPDFGEVHAAGELRRVLPDTDFVVLAAPLTAQTTGMIDAAALAAMRPGARLINVGRSPLVRTDDLVAALRSGSIAGAALDVFDAEPLPADSPLWTLPGLLVSPHMSGDFAGSLTTLAQLFVANFDRWRQGRPLHNVVDKHLGYVPGGAAGPATAGHPVDEVPVAGTGQEGLPAWTRT